MCAAAEVVKFAKERRDPGMKMPRTGAQFEVLGISLFLETLQIGELRRCSALKFPAPHIPNHNHFLQV